MPKVARATKKQIKKKEFIDENDEKNKTIVVIEQSKKKISFSQSRQLSKKIIDILEQNDDQRTKDEACKLLDYTLEYFEGGENLDDNTKLKVAAYIKNESYSPYVYYYSYKYGSSKKRTRVSGRKKPVCDFF